MDNIDLVIRDVAAAGATDGTLLSHLERGLKELRVMTDPGEAERLAYGIGRTLMEDMELCESPLGQRILAVANRYMQGQGATEERS